MGRRVERGMGSNGGGDFFFQGEDGIRGRLVTGFRRVLFRSGQLHAVDLETGEGIWSQDTHDRYDVRKGFFGDRKSVG